MLSYEKDMPLPASWPCLSRPAYNWGWRGYNDGYFVMDGYQYNINIIKI